MVKRVIIIAGFIILAGIAAYEGGAMFGKNKVSGRLMDAVILSGPSGEELLLILTDGSWEYMSKSKRPGKEVTGRKGLFCKTYLYLYDLSSGKVLDRVKTKYDNLPPDSVLIPVGQNIWEVSVDYSYQRPHLRVLSRRSGDVVMTWEQFSARFPELSPGAVRLIAEPTWPPYIEIYTSDGKILYYSIETDKMFPDKKSFLASLDLLKEEVTLFKLVDPSGGKRRRLFKLVGPTSKLSHISIPKSYFSKPELFQRFYQATLEPMAEDKVFLEGWIAFQDSDLVVVVHQDKVGKNSPRRITCIGLDGTLRWELSQAQIFPFLERKADDPFTDPTFMEGRLRVKRQGRIMLFVLARKGIMGVDAEKGNVLWTIKS